MSSIVLELQHATMDRRTEVDDLLRRCVAIASKLRLEDRLTWARGELSGYEKGADVPAYRIVPAEVKAFNPYNGLWLPFIWENKTGTYEQIRRNS